MVAFSGKKREIRRHRQSARNAPHIHLSFGRANRIAQKRLDSGPKKSSPRTDESSFLSSRKSRRAGFSTFLDRIIRSKGVRVTRWGSNQAEDRIQIIFFEKAVDLGQGTCILRAARRLQMLSFSFRGYLPHLRELISCLHRSLPHLWRLFCFLAASWLPSRYHGRCFAVTNDFLSKDYLSYSTSTMRETDTTGTSQIYACANGRTVLLPEQGRKSCRLNELRFA